MPEDKHVALIDTPELAADTLVWMTKERRLWLSGRYVSCTWDMTELEAKKEQEAVMSYGRLKALWARMLKGEEDAEREWMHKAEDLVESFRETRALFLTSRVRLGDCCFLCVIG